MSKDHSYKATVNNLPETSEVEIKSSIKADELAEAIQHTLEHIKADVTLPGFRKGAAPDKLVREKVGEAALLAEAAEHAISHAYMHILEDEKIDAIGSPRVEITKLAEGNDLDFTIRAAVVPKISKLDYKKITAEENKKPLEVVEAKEEDLKKVQEKMPEVKMEDLVKQNEYKAKEKKRLALVEALAASIDVVVPEVLVESELRQMTAQMKADIERMGLQFGEYLKHLGKTEDDMKKEWRADAVKRVKLELAIGHIADTEKIVPNKEKIEAEVAAAVKNYPGLDEDRARGYFMHLLLNQAVFEFLEGVK
ncbi:MAG: trigger factor [bacterium]|nr:trigger factor [bacterium]